jgi:hypothetical protein
MTISKLRDLLSEHIEYTFPDIPVWVEFNGRVYEIGRIRMSDTRFILEAGEEEERSKMWSQEDAL